MQGFRLAWPLRRTELLLVAVTTAAVWVASGLRDLCVKDTAAPLTLRLQDVDLAELKQLARQRLLCLATMIAGALLGDDLAVNAGPGHTHTQLYTPSRCCMRVQGSLQQRELGMVVSGTITLSSSWQWSKVVVL